MKVIIQKGAMDCGPCCLHMVIRHYGGQVDRDLLRNMCSIGKDGVSLLGVSKATEEIGFKWLSCFEFTLIINARNDGELSRFLLVLYLGAVF